MMVLNGFAQKTFSDFLFETEEGKSIGLTYFKERGFSEAIIRKFQLGYSLNEWEAFTKHALANAFQPEYLVKTGLTIEKNDSPDSENSKVRRFDRFKGRVMFPIHNLSGRVIGFGGRILKKTRRPPSMSTLPNRKSTTKPGAVRYVFRQKIHRSERRLFLVEGYTDVISLHQAGIENAVASSGTSLTTNRYRLISRYTKNITILYDGDDAGSRPPSAAST
jgi:DNA primase